MSDAPLMNDEAARTSTGEILDQATPPTTSPTPDGTTPPEAKTEDAPKPEAKDPPKPEGAPATYEAFTLPEGVTLSKETLDSASATFRELGLSQDAAQKLVSFHAEQLKSVTSGDAYTAVRQDWQSKTLADADIKSYSLDGKSGIDAVKLDIGRALGTLDSKLAADFRSAMDVTGAGDHPAFVKALWRLAQSIGEGRPVSGKGPSPEGQRAPGTTSRPSAAHSLYPNNP